MGLYSVDSPKGMLSNATCDWNLWSGDSVSVSVAMNNGLGDPVRANSDAIGAPQQMRGGSWKRASAIRDVEE